MFQWTADGKLQEIVIKAEDIEPEIETKKDVSAFGRLSKNIPDGKSILSGKSGFSAKSIASGNTEVAFSEQNYPVGENQEEGAILMKIQGKPGINKRNLLVIPSVLFFLLFSVASAIQQSILVLY